MKSRNYAGISLLASLAACNSATAETVQKNSTQAPQKPNVIVILADDLGYGDLKCYGAKNVETPHVDKLASEGIRFTNAHTVAATSTPSRYSLLTGEYAWRRPDTDIAAGDVKMIIRPEQYTMADMFKSAGYATAAIGKWHLGLGDKTGGQDWNAPLPAALGDLGFDYHYIMAATADRVPCVFIENGKVANYDPSDPIEVSYTKNFPGEPTGKDNPELLYNLHPSNGHDMSIVNGISRIGFMKGGGKALWKDEKIAETLTEKAIRFIEQQKDKPFFLYLATQDAHVPRVPGEQFAGKSGMGPRGDCLLEFDWTVGQVLDALQRLGLDENTLVILSSDNGPVVDDGYKDQAVELLGNHKPGGIYRGGKYSAYEAGTRVPCIWSWPAQIKSGQVSDALVSQIDWMATLAKVVGADIPQGAGPDSRPQLDAWTGKDKIGRETLVTQNAANNLSLLSGEWKYIRPGGGAAYEYNVNIELGNSKEPQLYNLKQDPQEKHNVATQYPEILKVMSEKLEDIVDGRYGLPLY